MNIKRIKLVGLVLPVLAVAVALTVFAIGPSSDTTLAATDGAAMSLRVPASDTFPCAGGPVPGKVCVDLDAKFDVIVVADAIPNTNGYILAQAWIDYDSQGLVHKKDTQLLWPDCDPAASVIFQDEIVNGAQTGCLTALIPPLPASFHKGDLFSFSLTCTSEASSSQIDLIPLGVAPANTFGSAFVDLLTFGTQFPAAGTGITVNCASAPVGGIAGDSDLRTLPLETAGSAGSLWGIAVALIAASGLLAFGGAAWYARRRWAS